MFLAACITNPETDYAFVQVIGRIWPTVEECRANFSTAWATFNGSSLGFGRDKTPKAYAIVQVVEGIEIASEMTFKVAGLDAFAHEAGKPAKQPAE